jgi:elongation factor Ts
MSNVSAAAVMALRNRTNAPMMDCKSALVEAGGDMEKATEILRKRNKAIMDKKADRETAEGRIAVFIDPEKKVGAILEMRCESAPSAKNEQFIKLADDLARHIALKAPQSVAELESQPLATDPKHTVHDRIAEAVGLIREKMRPARFVRLTGLLGSYIHHDGTVGVLVQVEGNQADQKLLREIGMHIVANNPLALRREDIPAATIEREREIAKSQAAATGKPANIVEKIAEGKLKTWFGENVLLEQPFVVDPSKGTVGDLLKASGLKLVRFVRLKMGELSPNPG